VSYALEGHIKDIGAVFHITAIRAAEGNRLRVGKLGATQHIWAMLGFLAALGMTLQEQGQQQEQEQLQKQEQLQQQVQKTYTCTCAIAYL
jgi:L-cystine uptake protein TcyP (sodium:dicarboxylate symporter family)